MRAISITSCALLLATASASVRAHAAVEAMSPAPIALPFYGESLDPDAVAGDLVALTLSPDGSYRRRHCHATPCVDAPTEIGTFTITTSRGKQLIHFQDQQDGLDKYEIVSGAANELWLRRSGASRWVALAPQPDESLCDGTGGSWRDDDANPQTGLYCDCSAGTYWNAAGGGCVNRPR
jgi:hypothetical protein